MKIDNKSAVMKAVTILNEIVKVGLIDMIGSCVYSGPFSISRHLMEYSQSNKIFRRLLKVKLVVGDVSGL